MWYEIFPTLLNMTLTASIIIVCVMLARLRLRKAPKVFSYALWGVVLFRLLCPITFSSQMSLLNPINIPAADNGQIEFIPSDIVSTENPSVNAIIPSVRVQSITRYHKVRSSSSQTRWKRLLLLQYTLNHDTGMIMESYDGGETWYYSRVNATTGISEMSVDGIN